MSALRERAEAVAQEYVGEWDGDDADVYRSMVTEIERVAKEYAIRCLVRGMMCGCGKCVADVLRSVENGDEYPSMAEDIAAAERGGE